MPINTIIQVAKMVSIVAQATVKIDQIKLSTLPPFHDKLYKVQAMRQVVIDAYQAAGMFD